MVSAEAGVINLELLSRMNTIFLEFVGLIEKKIGAGGSWATLFLIGLFLLFWFIERFQKVRVSSASNEHKKFDTFFQVFSGSLIDKQPIIIEQGFLHYFDFSLTSPEIQLILNSTKPTKMINDIRIAGTLVEFLENEEKYIVKTYIPIKARKVLSVLLYWMLAIWGLASIVQLAFSKDFGWLFHAFISFSLALYSLNFVASSYATSRIGDGYKQRTKMNLIVLLK
jgi:hypothetical protein